MAGKFMSYYQRERTISSGKNVKYISFLLIKLIKSFFFIFSLDGI